MADHGIPGSPPLTSIPGVLQKGLGIVSIGGTNLTPEQADTICARIAEGRSLNSISKDPDVPASSTIYEALADCPAFAEKYARAREIQADKMFAEIIDIADDGTRDYVIDPDRGIVADHDHIARSRLRVDARRCALSKMLPKKYGDRLTHAGDPDAPIAISGNITIKFVKASPREASDA
jgi:hypothetical protein